MKVYLILFLAGFLILLTGCIGGGGGGMDFNAYLKNPVIQVMIGIVILWALFRQAGKGK